MLNLRKDGSVDGRVRWEVKEEGNEFCLELWVRELN